MKFFIVLILSAALAVTSSASGTAGSTENGLTSADRDYLIRAVASSFPDVSFAARVGIISVIMNRISSDGYPDTAAGAIVSMSSSFAIERMSAKPDPKLRRITEDALEAVLAGARPVGDAVSFICHDRAMKRNSLAARLPLDLFFDNTSERSIKSEILTDLNSCTVIIDGIGFTG